MMGGTAVTAAQEAASWPQASSPIGLSGLAAAVFVLALVGMLAWLARRGRLGLPVRSNTTPVTVRNAVALGERRSLVIVSVEGRRLLLGLTPTHVSLVAELAPDTASRDAAATLEHARGTA